MNQEGAARPHDRRRRYQQMSSVSIKIDFQITLLKSELDPVLVTQLSMHFLLEKDDLNQEKNPGIEIEHQIGKKRHRIKAFKTATT